MSTVGAMSQGTGDRRRLPRAAAFWLVAATTATLLAASSAPSPLYPVFQAKFGFSALTLTTIFAVYVLALLLSANNRLTSESVVSLLKSTTAGAPSIDAAAASAQVQAEKSGRLARSSAH